MIYSSLLFIYGFLPLSLLVYYLMPRKAQTPALLAMSVIFCGLFGLRYLVFVSAYALINYGAAGLISRYRGKNEMASAVFAIGVSFDIISVFVFRTELFSPLRSAFGFPERFFPIGISFMALSAIGTLIDIYSGKEEADSDIVRFSLYFLFFPRLIMGPVLRYRSFVKVLESRRSELDEIGVGLTIFVKGLSKKVIAADTLYILYEAVRSTDVQDMSILTAWLGIIAYMLCLYFTLSGLSDMGIGAGYCFGMRMPQSFNYPLFSSRIRYFGAGWHIQTVQWMRRYVTKPLYSHFNGRIVRRLLFICVWAIFGFWYTFSLNGLMWGVFIGTAITIESRINRGKIIDSTGIIYTGIVVMMSGALLSGEDAVYSFRYLLAMAGSGSIADKFSFYLVKSYIVILLICMYASTNLFRNMMVRSGKNRIRIAFAAISPLVVLAALILCTALMMYSGDSGMILMKL
jgi:alginate O-acetyltransferase complex protein AlgI